MKCDRVFSGMTAFDRHWAKVPMRAGEPCREPEDVGLEQKPNGVWGMPGQSQMGWIIAGREYEAEWERMQIEGDQ